jgi:hypothetical protein
MQEDIDPPSFQDTLAYVLDGLQSRNEDDAPSHTSSVDEDGHANLEDFLNNLDCDDVDVNNM